MPRPAMFVATVTLPGWPAAATISASVAISWALSTLCSMPGQVEQPREDDRLVDRPRADQDRPALAGAARGFPATIACHFSSPVPKTRSGSRLRWAGRFVGTGITTL